MSFLLQEHGRYEPPACPGCLRRREVDWIECTTFEQLARDERWFVPGRSYCRSEGCAYNETEQAR